MRFSGNCLIAAAAAVVLVSVGAARADEASLPGQPNLHAQPPAGRMNVGVGVICNTTAQAEQFIRLRNKGADITPAVDLVNRQEHDPQACGVAAVAFQRDETVAKRSQNGKLVSIVRSNVLAGYDVTKWARVPAMVQYAIIEDHGITI